MDYELLIIKALYENGGGQTVKQIMKNCGIPKSKEKNVVKAAKTLINYNTIFKNRNNQFYISDNRKVFQGKVVSLNRTFGFITNLLTGEDYFVSGGKLKGAVPGDIVICKELSEKFGTQSATCCVLAPLDTTEQLFTGVIVSEGRYLKVLPDTLGCPPLTIVKVAAAIRENDKVLFSIRKRGLHHSEHTVDIEQVLGSSNKASCCTDAYLMSERIPTEFSEAAVLQAKEYENAVIDMKTAGKRLDLRDVPIFTIDGADTKDIDDAVSIEKTETGYMLGVHIADVSHYVKENSPLDNDAFTRGTSVYIADRVIPMLPRELSNGICSLNPDEDRLAFSCLMEISFKGKLKAYKFKKTVIRSRVKGVYSEVNAIIEGTADKEILDKYKEVADRIPLMKELADILSANKVARGAPEIQSDESKIICDENGVCIDIKKRQQGISEGIIEEFMLMANNSAARLAMKKDLPFVYRVHENPPTEKLASLKTTLEALQLSAYGINEKASAGDFARLLEKYKEHPKSAVINRIVLRTMAKAKYSEKPLGHFGLVMPEYAHFTSPIRRYADLSIHRILSDYVAKRGTEKIQKAYAGFAVKAANQATHTEISAVNAERTCEEYYMAEYMVQHIGKEFEGIISGVIGSGFFVALANTVEGKVDTATLKDGVYEVVNGITLIETLSGVSYTIGDKVRVKCIDSNINSGQIDFELIEIINNDNA